MSIVITRNVAEEAWRRFVETHPMGNVFHTPEMFEVFRRARGHRPELWAATNDGRILALLMPVQVTLKAGLLHFLTTRAVVYGSVLCAPDVEGQEALAKLLHTYKEEVRGRPLFTELRNLSNLEEIQPVLQQCGFGYEDHLNYLIDLDCPVEEILQNIGRRTRKNIRRGLRRGEVTIAEVEDRERLAACYELLCRTYRLAQIPLADYSLFEAAFDVLCPKGMARFTLAYVEQIPVAVSLELLYKNVVYGWYGGVDRDYSSYMPNELLMWHILEWSAENGYKVYDFGGAGTPDEDYGVRDFKAKFGGDLVCFGRNTYIHAPTLFKLSQLGYAVYQKLLSVGYT